MTLKIISGAGEALFDAAEGMTLAHALAAAGAPLSMPCGGHGRCGKCRVRAAGALNPPPDADGTCLACISRITGDATVWTGPAQPMLDIEIAGAMPDFPLDPLPGRLGLAADVGTTTLAAKLIRLSDGQTLGSAALENPQRAVAHDVIGRTQAALEGRGDALRAQVAGALGRMAEALCARSGVSPEQIDQRVITGNTTMLYLLTGRSPRSLAAAPFEADCLFGFSEDGAYLPPCFGAYVGADIACALLASDLVNRHETAMLADIGTNGEICLWHKGRLYCCATAAGPAFEGAGISCGLSSVAGAVEAVSVQNGKLVVSVIGGGAARGVCGSGLIDAVAALLEIEAIDETGFMEDGQAEIAPGVTLTQRDVRTVQLAKGSICAGMRAIMEIAGVAETDVAKLYIAGGFGRHINCSSARRIGLIPPFPDEKIRVIGNAALSGAQMLLLNRDMAHRARALTALGKCVNLAKSPEFQALYPECMLFGEAEI